MYFVDSHCHLDMLDPKPGQDDLNQIIKRANASDVKHMLNVSVTIRDFPKVLKIAECHTCVSASVGLHPNEQEENIDEASLIHLGQHKKVVAIGETGLDYYRTTADTAWQQDRFRIHIAAAKQLQKPLIIHTRQAKEATLAIMKEEDASQVGGVMHCFTEDWDMAKKALDLGFYISFSGIVTFKNASTIQTVAQKIPMDRMLIETDAPYLAPMPHRGKQNEPAFVRLTAEFIASMRQISLEALAEATTSNFFNLFKGAEKHDF